MRSARASELPNRLSQQDPTKSSLFLEQPPHPFFSFLFYLGSAVPTRTFDFHNLSEIISLIIILHSPLLLFFFGFRQIAFRRLLLIRSLERSAFFSPRRCSLQISWLPLLLCWSSFSRWNLDPSKNAPLHWGNMPTSRCVVLSLSLFLTNEPLIGPLLCIPLPTSFLTDFRRKGRKGPRSSQRGLRGPLQVRRPRQRQPSWSPKRWNDGKGRSECRSKLQQGYGGQSCRHLHPLKWEKLIWGGVRFCYTWW